MDQQFRTVLTWTTNEIIHVTFKVAGILLRKFPQSMPQPKDTYWKKLSKKYCTVLQLRSIS